MEKNEKALELIKKVNELKGDLNYSIRNFDYRLSVIVNNIENGLTACQTECNNPVLAERLAKLEEFCRIWNSLSNGIRCIL